MATVQLNHLAKAYADGPRVIRNVSIEVADREFLVLVGPSGCGKSTLLRMIAGLEAITDGDLLIDGRRVNDVPPKDRDIAMVFQNYALYPHMTVFENMAFGLKLRDMPKVEIRQRVERAAQILDITALLDRKPKDMSGGQRQRVAIGRAIVREPKVFLFDEPLSNLDAKLRGQTRIELQKLHRQLNATMIYVTHDQVEAMTLGDRIVVLRGGDVMQFDTPINLYNHPANLFVAGFIGTPPMNLIAGTLSAADPLTFVDESGAVRLPLHQHPAHGQLLAYRGKAVTLGLRAEHLTGQPTPDRPTQSLTVLVDSVENMGNELLVYGQAGPHRLTARLTPDQPAAIGQPLTLHADLTKAHVFDSSTEQAIGGVLSA